MEFPQEVLFCIEKLNQAGYSAYAVGGCVRDKLLGLAPHDFDLCTSALPSETAAVFCDFDLVHSGEKHGTIGVVIQHNVYEITTYRTEGGYGDSRHPDWVKFVPTVEEDLSRRDFTVNAMAWSPQEGLIDPFGGQADMENHILRAVGAPERRFQEDALRILRGVRFAVRFDLVPEENTFAGMLAQKENMQNLAVERVFDELCKLLPLVSAADLIKYQPILTAVLPELAPCVGFQQKNPHHIHDVYNHTAHVVENTPPELAVRWAALLHDAGKPGCFSLDERGVGHFYGHAEESAHLADKILLRLKSRTALRKQVVTLIAQHMTPLTPDPRLLRRRVSKLGMDTVKQLLQLQMADMGGKGRAQRTNFGKISAMLQSLEQENACLRISDLAVNGHDLMALGYRGQAIGNALDALLQLVLDEKVENKKESLLKALQK